MQLPGGKLHVLHTQQTGGVTSTSLAGNAVLKKMGESLEQSPQQRTVFHTIDESQQTQQVVSDGSGDSALKQFVPVTKVQITPAANAKSTPVEIFFQNSLYGLFTTRYAELFYVFEFQMFVKSTTNVPTIVPKIGGGAVLVGSGSQVVGPQQIIIGGKSLAGQVIKLYFEKFLFLKFSLTHF